jgi:hypothetical protein
VREPRKTYLLSFVLPPPPGEFAALWEIPAPAGRHEPAPGATLTIGERTDAGFPIIIESRSRVRAFDHARAFLKIHAKGRAPFTLEANLDYPPMWPGERGGSATWHISVNSTVTFSYGFDRPDVDVAEPRAMAPAGEAA